MVWLARQHGLQFANYDELWAWSVGHVADFWASIWDYFAVTASAEPEAILPRPEMPGAEWFRGARLNYAENVFARMKRNGPAVVYQAEEGPVVELDYEIPAQHSRGHRRLAGDGEPRRHLVKLLARLRQPQRPRPLQPD
jgi:acetoacetyl-CoA synthetase